jgi:hypothetical protein
VGFTLVRGTRYRGLEWRNVSSSRANWDGTDARLLPHTLLVCGVAIAVRGVHPTTDGTFDRQRARSMPRVLMTDLAWT